MSGFLLDRLDIHVEVPRVGYEKLTDDRLGEPSAHIRARIEKARQVQRQRFEGAVGGLDGNVPLLCNADMGPVEVREHYPLDAAGKSMLRAAMTQLGTSARAFHRTAKRQAGAHYRGSGRRTRHPDASLGGGDSVPPKATTLITAERHHSICKQETEMARYQSIIDVLVDDGGFERVYFDHETRLPSASYTPAISWP